MPILFVKITTIYFHEKKYITKNVLLINLEHKYTLQVIFAKF